MSGAGTEPLKVMAQISAPVSSTFHCFSIAVSVISTTFGPPDATCSCSGGKGGATSSCLTRGSAAISSSVIDAWATIVPLSEVFAAAIAVWFPASANAPNAVAVDAVETFRKSRR